MKNIVLENNEKTETNFFLRFLHHKEFPQLRNVIFSSFSELKEKIDLSKENENVAVSHFLKKIREDNKEVIEKAVVYIKKEVEKNGAKTLQILADLMDYKWGPKSVDYVLIPTILPFCPFGKNIFLYSIYRSLKGKTEFPDVLAVSAHEVSHLILFDILKDNNIKLSQDLLYFVKELVAPILVYQDDFNKIFKKEISGNYNVLEIYFEQDKKIIKAFDYFLEMFNKNRFEKKDFIHFLKDMISVCKKIELKIKHKRSFDNKYGMKILKDPKLLKKFREPIKLNQ